MSTPTPTIPPTPQQATKDKLAAMVAALRAKREAEATLAAAQQATPAPQVPQAPQAPLTAALEQAGVIQGPAPTPAPATAVTPAGVSLNEKQSLFVQLAGDLDDPRPVVLLGPAGTGKTTAISALFQRLFTDGAIPQVQWRHRHLPDSSLGAVVVAFTRRATTNVRKRMPKDVQTNAITIHKLLEYAPVDEMVPVRDKQGKETGKQRLAKVFRPMRDALNQLPPGLKLVIVEEVSMLGLLLDRNLQAALPSDTKLVLVGDLAQLVPVMDSPALAKYLQDSHIVELTDVYRQALDSPIISLATDVRRGKGRMVPEKVELLSPDGSSKLTLHPWKKLLTVPQTLNALAIFFREKYAAGEYDPVEDQILIPFYKADTIGSVELNKHLGTMISRANGREVFQIVAGFETRHYAVGDYCIFDKEDCEILEIKKNRAYAGKPAAPSSLTMDYWGHDPQRKAKLMENDAQAASDDVDHLLYMAAPSFDPDNPDGSRVTAASHAVRVRMLETGTEELLTSAADINKLELAYAMTVHKAQGSEWERVFVVMHKDHACMLSRELLYTAVTRAKKELYVLCEKDTIVKACLNQEIKGETLEEKIRGLKLKLKIAEMRVQ